MLSSDFLDACDGISTHSDTPYGFVVTQALTPSHRRQITTEQHAALHRTRSRGEVLTLLRQWTNPSTR